MTTPPTERADALQPVRADLLRAAHLDAEALLTEARREAAETLDAARTEADALLDRARRQGEAEGAAAAAATLARARRTARARELGALGEAYRELRRRVAVRVRELHRDRPDLRERLEARARTLLGPEAVVAEHPDGGVLAWAPGRRVDLGLPALADRALDRLGTDAESLWAP